MVFVVFKTCRLLWVFLVLLGAAFADAESYYGQQENNFNSANTQNSSNKINFGNVHRPRHSHVKGKIHLTDNSQVTQQRGAKTYEDETSTSAEKTFDLGDLIFEIAKQTASDAVGIGKNVASDVVEAAKHATSDAVEIGKNVANDAVKKAKNFASDAADVAKTIAAKITEAKNEFEDEMKERKNEFKDEVNEWKNEFEAKKNKAYSEQTQHGNSGYISGYGRDSDMGRGTGNRRY